MTAFGKSQSVPRREDTRLLTGAGRFMDDSTPKDALHAVFLRAPVAHGRILSLDLSAAQNAPGVHAVLDTDALHAAGLTQPMQASLRTNRDGSTGANPPRPLLARDRVTFVGEAVAMVVADTPAQARDALELIELDIAPLPPHLDLAPGGPEIHPQAPDNIAYDWAVGDESAVQAAFEQATHRIAITVDQPRLLAASMEPRGAYAEWDGTRLHFCFGGQGVWVMKERLAKMLGLAPQDVRVTTPDVGGGFGMKGMPYPEYFVIAHAAKALGRPVRWVPDRSDAIVSDNAGRDLRSHAELALDADGRILGYRVENWSNLGAWNSEFAQGIQSQLFSMVATGAYDIPAAFIHSRGIYTNTTQVDAYRGAGRPEAITVLERLMDKAARKLGLCPFALRARNFIAPDAFPHATVAGDRIHEGEFARLLEEAREHADVAGFPARRAQSKARGRKRGLGLCYYIESIMGNPVEDAEIAFNDDGTVSLMIGTQSNGQGHETVFAQFLSDRTGIPLDAIHVVQGDSDRIAKGGGTGGSRSVTVQTNATLATVGQMVAAFTDFLKPELGDDVGFDDGSFRAPGSNRTLTLIEAADLARSQGRADLLQHAGSAKLDARSYPNGAHLAEVELDPETGALQVLNYTAVDDFGNLLNPQLVQGQVHGGIAQGLGQAICEQVVFDDQGQPLTGSFMDYPMPRASDMPPIRFHSVPVPAKGNPLGLKGCGEAGTVGAIAAIVNAVQDALGPEAGTDVQMPLTPERIWRLCQTASA